MPWISKAKLTTLSPTKLTNIGMELAMTVANDGGSLGSDEPIRENSIAIAGPGWSTDDASNQGQYTLRSYGRTCNTCMNRYHSHRDQRGLSLVTWVHVGLKDNLAIADGP